MWSILCAVYAGKLGANLFYVNHFKEIILIKRNAEGNFRVALLKCVRKIYERSGLRKKTLHTLEKRIVSAKQD